jgi:hypothetical protein
MPSSEHLPNTDWSLIERAGATAGVLQREAIHVVLKRYVPALTAHVRAKFRAPLEEAQELVQAFLAAKIVEGNLVGQARRERGRFRNFIRSTLDAFVVSHRRALGAKKRTPDRLDRLDAAEEVAGTEPDPQHVFALIWAKEVIAAAVEGTGRECRESGRLDLWGVFESRILKPTLEGDAPAAYEDLVQRFNFGSPLQAANALTTAKRMFERNLRAVLREYVDDEREVDQEIQDLRSILAGGSASRGAGG